MKRALIAIVLCTLYFQGIGQIKLSNVHLKDYLKDYKDNTTYRWLLQPRSDFMAWYSEEEEVFIVREGFKFGIIDKNGERLVASDFNTNSPRFSEGLAYIERNGHWHYINRHGEVIVETPHFVNTNLPNYNEGFVNVKSNTYWGFINKKGQQKIDFRFRNAKKFSEGLAAVRNDTKEWGYVDTLGKMVIPFFFDQAMDFHDGYARVRVGNNYYYIDKTGKKVENLRYGYGNYSEGFAPIKLNNKWGFMNTSGDIIAGPYYDAVGEFHEGYARVQLNEKIGFINTNGELIVPIIYDPHPSSYFSEGVAFVKQGELGGFINKAGAKFLPFMFHSATAMRGGVCTVKIDGKWGAIEIYEKVEEPKDIQIIEGPHIVAIDNSASIRGTVFDTDNSKAVQAQIVIIPVSDPENPIELRSHSESGKFRFDQLELHEKYLIQVRATGYLSQSDTVKMDEAIFVENFHLAPFKINEVFQLENVFFERGESHLLVKSYSALNKLSKIMRDNPSIKIELAGHTDNRGNEELNKKLSEQRVQTVKEYLVESGIQEKRIKGHGFGGTKPIYPNDTEDNRARNRRVEVRFIE